MTLDYGVRCPNHTGEIFQPRCNACQSLTAEYRALGLLPTEEVNR